MSIRLVRSMLCAVAVVSAVGCQKPQGLVINPEPQGDVTARQKVTHVEELLIGKAGVDVQRTSDGGYSVSIRGTGSFMSSEQPLYVIDGVPYEVNASRGLGWLNPSDVTRIDVLKNPTETTLYGVRGGNGVIVITTRRPKSS